jgi:hypothetical protein
MMQLDRKPRPLMRDSPTFRDDRLFIVGCDDMYAPDQYFGFFKLTRVHVHVVPTLNGTSTAQAVLDRVLDESQKAEIEPDDELWMVLDTDHCIAGTHLASFTAALTLAEQKGVRIALSRPCFELWLLLHHAEETEVATLATPAQVQQALRDKLGGYSKSKLKMEHFSADNVAMACARSQRLDKAVGGGRIPIGNSSRVYLLWKAIVAKAQGAELPLPLRNLILK